MNWKNVRLIFHREARDQIRDRRTLFMVVVLPLLLYPGLAIGMVQVSLLFREQPRTVVVVGSANLPQKPPLLDGSRFSSEWFSIPADAEKLQVVADAGLPPQDDAAAAKRDADLLTDARELRPLAEQLDRLEQAARRSGNGSEADRLADQIRAAKEKLSERFSATKIQVLIIVPAGLTQRIEETNRTLAAKGNEQNDAARSKTTLGFLVIENSADEKSTFAYQRVKQVLAAWEQRILQERLSQANLPPTLATPVNPVVIDVAAIKQLSASIWSKMFPTLLIIMAVTGAFYPAVDVAAGEKERGTMETLLICPAQRSEIVVGKFFTVLLFSVANVLLNLASMGFTGKYVIAASRTEAMSKMGAGTLSFPGPWEMMWLAILLVPLAAFYSAISLALATFARSTREGQYYLTPLLFVTLGLTLFCLSPAVEIEPLYSILPVVGPALLLKEVLADPNSRAPLIYGLPVLLSSVAYSLAGLWWAIVMFNREDVLFREAERFDVRIWLRHLLRDKEPTPSSSEAVLCFVLIMLLQFGALPFLRAGHVSANGQIDGSEMLRLLLIQQLVFVACPALFMGIMLTTSVVRTFRLRLPSWNYLLMACLLPLALHPLSVGLEGWLQQWFFPPLPDQIVQIARIMGSSVLPLWMVVLAVAAAPALCEELAFRGLILSGFARSARPGVAIVLSSVAFGIAHMVPQQVFNATLLGLVLGLFALRSGSLLPGILFHLIYNSIEILRARATSLPLKGPAVDWFISLTTTADNEHIIQYKWPTLAIAAVIAVLLIGRLVGRIPGPRGATHDTELPGRDRNAAASPPTHPPVATR
ncbi:MAG TPA: ABC transporter permease subunit/CPBP intramembrane protease [Planctomycetaceae bacterium]|jgi:sodium transport system permease protein|nr:ABC transporter permease subunit/CPBP intramembrane protease [Planctomycetaceae bacterium]